MNDIPRGMAERYLLGGVLVHGHSEAGLAEEVLAVYPVVEWLDPECRLAAAAVGRLAAGGEVVDVIRLSDALAGEIRDAYAWVLETAEIGEAHLGAKGVRWGAARLHDEHVKALHRAVLQGALTAAQNPQLRAEEVEGILREGLARVEAADPGDLQGADQVAAYFSDLEIGEARPLPTPWAGLNQALAGGAAPGELVIIGARPSIGKSALAINWAWHAAATGGNVVVFSLEMTRKQVFDRIAAKLSQVDLRQFRGRMCPETLARARDAQKSMLGRHIYVDERGMLRPAEIRRICRARAKIAPLSLVVIDYLQLVTPDNPSGSREQDVSGISRHCKLLAKDLQVPVLLLSQLNRECEKHGREPILADLRESGAIEQDADIILFLHCREADLKAAQLFGRAEPLKVIIAKGRSTGRGDVGLNYNKACQNIYDMDAQDYAAVKRGQNAAAGDNGL